MTNLERWNFYNRDLESPQSYIDYTWLCTVSAALQRRVALYAPPHDKRLNPMFPNVFFFFIGPPGIGKTMSAVEAKKMLAAHDYKDEKGATVQLIKRGPNSMTLEALTKYLADNHCVTKLTEEQSNIKGGVPYLHASLALFCDGELGTMLKEQTHDMVNFLQEAWDCRDFERKTKTAGTDCILNTCLTMIGNATPEWMKKAFSTSLLGQGFSARSLFIYEQQKRFLKHSRIISDEQIFAYEELKTHIKMLSTLFGKVEFSKEADEWYKDWYLHKNIRINKAKCLDDYYARKDMHLRKIAMLFHFSESTTMQLEPVDFERALLLLNKTEIHMDKALPRGGRNPLGEIVMKIEVHLEQKEGKKQATYKELRLITFDDCNSVELTEILQFMVECNKLLQQPGTDGAVYELVSLADSNNK